MKLSSKSKGLPVTAKVKKLPTVDIKKLYKNNNVVLEQVISGGQIGADYAGLCAARDMGFWTGGHLPHNFKTLVGNRLWYAKEFDCIDDCSDYKTRTWANVSDSDATIRLATNFDSPGERCTLNAIRHYRKLHLDIFMEESWISYDSSTDHVSIEYRPSADEVARWIIANNIRVLNIAGNANLSLEESIYDYLTEVFNSVLWVWK